MIDRAVAMRREGFRRYDCSACGAAVEHRDTQEPCETCAEREGELLLALVVEYYEAGCYD